MKKYMNEYSPEWRKRNPEKCKEYRRRTRKKYPEKYRALEKARSLRDPYRSKKYKALYPVKFALKQYQADAKKRGLEFLLDPRLFEDLVKDNCFYCGAAPTPINGVDRVDNSLGYFLGNVVTACRMCNRAKDTHSKKHFEEWAVRVAERMTKYAS
jgi:hypothetical protein